MLMLFFASVNAQFKQVAEGPVFKEPEEGYAKILLMKNGNTMFIHITAKEGINLRIYNAAHAEIAVTNVQPSYKRLNYGTVYAVFEINGDAVLMIGEAESRTPVLYRLIIDGKTGELKEDKEIARLDKVTFGQGYAIAFGNVPTPNFFVRKDPYSDNYAVVMFNSFESERSKRIEIVTYGPDNKEANRAYYTSPDEKYKYLRYVDMAVIGSDKVCVLAYGFNTARSGGKESELILANLDKGVTSVSFTELDFSKNLIVYWGIARFSPATRSIILSAIVKAKKSDEGYTPILAFVNPYERKIERADVIAPSARLNTFSKGGFTGLPENLFINNDGTFTIVSEEMRQQSSGSTINTVLGDMAIVNYSKTGEFTNDYIIRKKQMMFSEALQPFYKSEDEQSVVPLFKGNQFKSFSYLNSKLKKFILLNDTERNNDAQESGSLVTVSGVGESDGFYYPLTGTDPTLKREYIFGNPENKKDHNLALFAISDYDSTTNLYATLKLEREGSKKGVKVVWLQP